MLIVANGVLRLLVLLSAIPLSSATCNATPLWLSLGNCTITNPNGADIESWGALVSVGLSQQICVTPSTVVNTTIFMGSQLCNNNTEVQKNNMTEAQCASRCGGLIDPDTLPSASVGGLATENPGWVGIMYPLPAFNVAVDATLQLHDNVAVTMIEGIETEGNNHTATHLGLGDGSVLLDELVANDVIATRSWGLDSGSQSLLYPRQGNLVFGGYDDSSVLGPFTTYPMNYDIRLNERVCPLQVQVQSMALRLSDTYEISIFQNSQVLTACIEPYDNLFRLPSEDIQVIQGAFERVTGYSGALSPVPNSPDLGLYDLEPGLIYPNLANSTGSFNGSLVMTLNGNFTVEIPHYELQRPLRGLAANGSRILNDSFTELQIYQTPVPEDASVLGKVFLSMVYLYVDYDAREFKLANINNGATTPLIVGDDENCGASTGLSGTTIGLIVVSGVVAFLAVAVLWLLGPKLRERWADRRRWREDESGQPEALGNEDALPQVIPEPPRSLPGGSHPRGVNGSAVPGVLTQGIDHTPDQQVLTKRHPEADGGSLPPRREPELEGTTARGNPYERGELGAAEDNIAGLWRHSLSSGILSSPGGRRGSEEPPSSLGRRESETFQSLRRFVTRE